MRRGDPDAIVAAGELVEMRFRHGNALSLRAGKLLCLLIQEAGVQVVENAPHRIRSGYRLGGLAGDHTPDRASLVPEGFAA